MLSANVLAEVDLLKGSVPEARVNLYNTTIGTWTKVQVGHVITLKDRDHVFLKGLQVSDCPGFDNLLSDSQSRRPHFMNNLPQERAFVRKELRDLKRQPLVLMKTTSRSHLRIPSLLIFKMVT